MYIYYAVHVHILFNYSIRKISTNQKIKKIVSYACPLVNMKAIIAVRHQRNLQYRVLCC